MLLLKAVERNRGLMGPGSWEKRSWKIHTDGTSRMKTTYCPMDPDDPIPPQPPIPPVIKQKPISFRALTRNKTYSIKSEADIDAFLQEIRKSLMAELDDNTIIRLS